MLVCMTNLLSTQACTDKVQHFPPLGPKPAGVPADAKPPFNSSVLAGDTLYISGVLDIDPSTGKPGASQSEQIRLVLEAFKNSVEAAGFQMDELVWVQIFAVDLDSFNEFSAAYNDYFNGPLPARTFVGVARLMGGANFELNGIAVRNSGK